jgi:8-oxo-dGTP pyrophosphatase MutT (NUDIX family)
VRFEAAARRLERLPDPLPAARAELVPAFTDARLRMRMAPTATARASAVLVLVFPDRAGDARLVLTERVTYGGHHSGEVSFPGGKAEPADGGDPAVTAVREAGEEVGLDAVGAGVRVVGRLDEVFIPRSDFRIVPVVAVASVAPALEANPAEVARILTPSVSAILPDAPIEMAERVIEGWSIRYGGFRIDGLHVWGATARILGQLGAVLG